MEASGEDVKQETSDEFISFQAHDLLFIVVCIIFILKADLIIFHRKDSVIRDRDTMGIPSEIADELFGSSKGWFCIDNPVFLVNRPEVIIKTFQVMDVLEFAQTFELTFGKSLFDACEELSPKKPGDNFD